MISLLLYKIEKGEKYEKQTDSGAGLRAGLRNGALRLLADVRKQRFGFTPDLRGYPGQPGSTMGAYWEMTRKRKYGF